MQTWPEAMSVFTRLQSARSQTHWRGHRGRSAGDRDVGKLTAFFQRSCSHLVGREGRGAGLARPPIRAQPAAHINPPPASAPDSATAVRTERCSGSSPTATPAQPGR